MAQIQIFGGGFRGLVAAYLARMSGHEVRLIEAGKSLGGVLNSVPWNGLHLDLGCHLFDNTSDETTAIIFDMAGGEEAFHPVEVRYGSRTDGATVEGMAIPSFENLTHDRQARMLLGLFEAIEADAGDVTTLSQALETRFGPALARALLPMARKMFAEEPGALSSSALDMGLFKRVSFLDDDLSRRLKQLPEVDDRLAVSSAAAPLEFYSDVSRFPYRNFYPNQGGMGGFTKAAGETLAAIGVEMTIGQGIEEVRQHKDGIATRLSTGEEITGDIGISTFAPDAAERVFLGRDTLAGLTHSVPMVLFYFAVRPDALTGVHYMHDFRDDDLAFRCSAPGLYGNQVNDEGMTYVCAEVPTDMEGDLWADPDAFVPSVWSQMINAGIVQQDGEFRAFRVLKTPKSYSVGAVGYEVALERCNHDLEASFPSVRFSKSLTFGKATIMAEILESCADIFATRPRAAT